MSRPAIIASGYQNATEWRISVAAPACALHLGQACATHSRPHSFDAGARRRVGQRGNDLHGHYEGRHATPHRRQYEVFCSNDVLTLAATVVQRRLAPGFRGCGGEVHRGRTC
jgi:hypothetical protein